MKKKGVEWAVFLAILLAVGIYAVHPMPLSKVLPVDDGQLVDFMLTIPYYEPMGDTHNDGYWVKQHVYRFAADTEDVAAQALSAELKTIRCRRSLNPFAGKLIYSNRYGDVVISWLANGDRYDFEMDASKKTARIYRGRYYTAYVVEEGTFDRITAVLQTYGLYEDN